MPTTGHDEFAALGEEFNKMSRQLAERLEELNQERARSVRRYGIVIGSVVVFLLGLLKSLATTWSPLLCAAIESQAVKSVP